MTTTAPDPRTEPGYRFGRAVRHVVRALALLLVLGAVAYVVTRLDVSVVNSPTTGNVTVKEYDDAVGRHCVIASTDDAVDADCDYPPTEARLGGILEGLGATP